MSADQAFWAGVILGIAVMALIGGGMFFSMFLEERRRRWKLVDRSSGAVKPICGCSHHRSFHDDEGCHWVSQSRYDDNKSCGCKVYIGPAVNIEVPRRAEELG